MGNWSELPIEVLDSIASRVYSNCVVDYIRFGAVCKPWRSLFMRKGISCLPPSMPLLMVGGGMGFLNNRKLRNFYDIVNDDVSRLRHLDRSLLNLRVVMDMVMVG
ncbi:hypothetical protein GIB67_016985 [Kingdonia uniflora]|uniref:F-box domain-containing protein n=1 Tax=Kingdonia uniflora TaxID=39325 RepID=A0A7J7M3K6_9MAGN|nr:hypothetical protein GIB67_016985 [Kingdonia uniflora]